MEPISQLDVQAPDHVSVITRDGKITVSVIKDGSSVTLGFPIRSFFDTTPRFPLQQQPAPQVTAVKENQETPKVLKKKTRVSPVGNRKLTDQQVRTIKGILSNKKEMDSFLSKQDAYEWIAKAYGVSHHTISNIHKGLSWRDVKI
jgi:hypothetical protein